MSLKYDYPAKALIHFESIVYNNWEKFLDKFGKGVFFDLVRVGFNSSGVEFVYILKDGQHVVDGITLGKFLEWCEGVE